MDWNCKQETASCTTAYPEQDNTFDRNSSVDLRRDEIVQTPIMPVGRNSEVVYIALNPF